MLGTVIGLRAKIKELEDKIDHKEGSYRFKWDVDFNGKHVVGEGWNCSDLEHEMTYTFPNDSVLVNALFAYKVETV